MRKTHVAQMIAFAGLTAALYYILTVLAAPLSYGQIQCRISEILLFLCLHNNFAVWGYTVGCILANLSSPLGVLDVAVGGLSSFVSALIARGTGRVLPTLLIVPLIDGLAIGAELRVCYGLPFAESAVCVAVGEFLALLIGGLVYGAFGRRIQRYIQHFM